VQNSAFKGLAQMGQGNTPQEDLDKLSTSTLNDLGNAIESRIQNPTKKASEAWREFAQQATASIEQVVIKMAILKPMAAGLDNLFTTGSLTGAAGAAGAASPMSGLLGLLGFHFAGGGIMTSGGPIPLRRYAGGGVASSPQLAMFGEGSGAEAYVPLPDGRAIPVQMNGRANGGHTFNTNMNVHMNIPQGTSVEAAHSMTATAARQFRDVVNKAIDDRIVTHLRTGGLMNPA
jgi:phage-related minor tail protein